MTTTVVQCESAAQGNADDMLFSMAIPQHKLESIGLRQYPCLTGSYRIEGKIYVHVLETASLKAALF